MASVFSGAIDTTVTLVDNVDIIDVGDWNKLADIIIAIETALGANLSQLLNPGEIRMWAGAIADTPSAWLHCDGSEISRNTYVDLYTNIGTAYGVGDGSTTFNIPDSKNRFIVGAKQDSSGVAKSNLEGSLNKNGGSLTQPPTTSNAPQNGNCNSGPNQNRTPHSHTFTPPFVAFTYMIKT